MPEYNYANFDADHYELDNFPGPQPGQKAPDFALETLSGDQQNLLDFDGDFLVLELASITCPLFQSRRTTMKTLQKSNPDTSFSILYVREAHPGKSRPCHKHAEDKRNNALALRDVDHEGRKILLDDMHGTAHAAYGSFPNSVFIINQNGCVVYTSDWNNPFATGRALAALKGGKSAAGQGMFLPAKPPVAIKTLRDAGAGAAPDFLRSLPALIWKNLIKRNLRLIFRRPNPVLPDTRC
ncbi:MAG: deiodinase-like protein [Paracoccaceae bacterium]